MSRYVVGFLFNEYGAITLIRKTRPEWQAGKLNGIGGHVEAGETFDDAMLREGHEETGCLVRWEKFAILSPPPGTDKPWIMHCYRAVRNKAIPQAETDVGEQFECHTVADVMLGEVSTIPNLRWLLPMASEAQRPCWPYRITQGVGR